MRALAAWAWGQSLSWVFRVEDIQARHGMTRGQWRTLAREMTACGFMVQRKELDDDGFPVWCLAFNFTVFQGYQHDDHSGARVREWSKTTTRASGEKRPLARVVGNGRLNQDLKKPTFKKPPPARELGVSAGDGGGDADQKGKEEDQDRVQEIARAVGLTGDAISRFCKAAGGAAQVQLDLIQPIIRGASGIRDLEGFVVWLAKRAVAGGLRPPGMTAPEESGGGGQGERDELPTLDGWLGYVISGPGGPVAVVEEARRARCLKTGHLLHPQKIRGLVRRIWSGELEAKPQAAQAS